MAKPTPELDKLLANKVKRDLAQEFYDWITEGKGWVFCKYVEDAPDPEYADDPDCVDEDGLWVGPTIPTFVPIRLKPEEFIADFLGIDYAGYLAEREAIFQEVREEAKKRE